MEDVDLGICRAILFVEDRDRCAVALPGAGYPATAPLLWFGREVLQSHGWTVLQVVDTWDRSVEAISWANDRLDAALRYLGPRSE